MEPIEIADLDLKPLFGATFSPLSADDVVRRFGALAMTPSFYLTALADIAPQDEAAMRTYIDAERRLAAWAVQKGPAHLLGTVLFASTITRVAMVYAWRAEGTDEQAFCEGVLTLVEAAFRRNAEITYVMTALPAPPAAGVEDALAGWGFEPIQSAFDPLGTVTYGIRRQVADMVLSGL